MKNVSMRDFQKNAGKYWQDLPIILTRHNIPVAQVVPLGLASMEIKSVITPTPPPQVRPNQRAMIASPDKITELDVNEIAEKYKVSYAYVNYELEQLKNYCLSSGRRYKDYKAALRSFVLRDMKRQIEGRFQQNVRPAVDARGLSK